VSSSFQRGYEHGVEGLPEMMELQDDPDSYLAGYDLGQQERRELKDDYSSNT